MSNKVKMLVLDMEDGSTYHVPASIIARNRAEYYAKKDKTTNYQEEYNFGMEDEDQITDWYLNNMNPEDVAEFAVLVDRPKPTGFEYCDVEDCYVEEVEVEEKECKKQ